MINCISNCLP